MVRTFASIVLAATYFIGSSPMVWGSGKTGECYNVATWNLEYYSFSRTRGFPEYAWGGPKYPARDPQQRKAVAKAIRTGSTLRSSC